MVWSGGAEAQRSGKKRLAGMPICSLSNSLSLIRKGCRNSEEEEAVEGCCRSFFKPPPPLPPIFHYKPSVTTILTHHVKLHGHIPVPGGGAGAYTSSQRGICVREGGEEVKNEGEKGGSCCFHMAAATHITARHERQRRERVR